jgi:dienelactone hydrolase
VLVLQGDEDQLVSPAALDAFVANAQDPSMFTVVHYPGAHHGFDIPSLAEPQTYNDGKFEYQAAAAKASHKEVVAFRNARFAAADAPAECTIAQED